MNQVDETRLRTMQVLAAAIIAGAAIFLAVAVFIRGKEVFEAPADSPLITYALIGVGAVLAIACQIVPGIVTTAGRQRILEASTGEGDGPLLGLFQTQLIVGLALGEAAAFTAIIAYFLEGQTVSLIAALLFVGLLVTHFPTQRGVDAWLAEQSDWLQRE